ncbi:hypothetical protein, unlikely [Trypanosoma brucei brucei TREU927]|uniref:Uncharacterized protein n=1 Tax=Trypanosoma brucei brucei (strain 927/4 GUTat10.1) TaxID=185431 RepID=Q38FQ1_TRYB2|nr:hypothetical protein, unlikely [Trypanosoma brucei brucei TREU927]EAN76369.1 hypothetical protein, unlikely [Trypanosoma brucei brucei TREU927]
MLFFFYYSFCCCNSHPFFSVTAFGEDGLCSVALFSFVYSYLVHFNINISVFNYTMLIFAPRCIHSFSNAPFSRFKKK